jgi:HK97 gp10 family phage protein
MVIDVRFKIKGMRELERILRRGNKEVENKAQKAFKKIAWLITTQVKRGTPVDTARLRRSIHPIIRGLMVEILTEVFYSVYVEDGTKYMKGHHMFKNVIDKMGNDIPQMILDEIKKSL